VAGDTPRPPANGRGSSGGDSGEALPLRGGTALVIGFGNPLRGDDGAGFAAAELLARQLRADPPRTGEVSPGMSPADRRPAPRVEALACQQLTFDLAEAVSRVDLVVFIDADRSVPAGEFSEHEAGEDPIPPPVSHHLTPPALLAVTRAIYGSAPRGIVLSVGAAAIDAPGLSAAVEAALPRVAEVARAIAEARGRRDPGEIEGPK